MVVDTSAIVALLRDEPEADAIEDALDAATDVRISAFTALETRVVLSTRFGDAATAEFTVTRGTCAPEFRTASRAGSVAPVPLEFELLLVKLGVVVVPFDAAQAEHAHRTYRRFGKGTGHPAQLNLGDCVSYALATSLGLPLLFKGADFARTDVQPALTA